RYLGQPVLLAGLRAEEIEPARWYRSVGHLLPPRFDYATHDQSDRAQYRRNSVGAARAGTGRSARARRWFQEKVTFWLMRPQGAAVFTCRAAVPAGLRDL